MDAVKNLIALGFNRFWAEKAAGAVGKVGESPCFDGLRVLKQRGNGSMLSQEGEKLVIAAASELQVIFVRDDSDARRSGLQWYEPDPIAAVEEVDCSFLAPGLLLPYTQPF